MQVYKLKLKNLQNYLKNLESVAIAFSGGVDSTFLLKVAKDVLNDKVIAITSNSCFIPRKEMQEAEDFCCQLGVKHFVFNINPLENPKIKENPENRCYLCKKEIFTQIQKIAQSNGIKHVCEGSNMDDLGDYRPGLQAIKELEIVSPLRESELYKDEIRKLSEELKLPTWKKPSFACLASRFPYGEELSEENLKRIELAEEFLKDLGFTQMRVRNHQNIARIEVLENDFNFLLENHDRISLELKNLGFSYVTMDLQGYRTGSMNEVILKN